MQPRPQCERRARHALLPSHRRSGGPPARRGAAPASSPTWRTTRPRCAAASPPPPRPSPPSSPSSSAAPTSAATASSRTCAARRLAGLSTRSCRRCAAWSQGGTREVTLLGQNVLAYGKDLRERATFYELLRRLNDLEGLWRVRFTTCHPRDVDEDLIRAFVELPKVCRHLHLPIQAGTDELLLEMRRGYTVAEYVAVVERLRRAVPDLGLTTDIMVGLPRRDRRGLRGAASTSTSNCASMPPSPSPTRSAPAPSPRARRSGAEAVKIARLERLIAMQNRITWRRTRPRSQRGGARGRPGRERGGAAGGKTRQHKQVVFPGSQPDGVAGGGATGGVASVGVRGLPPSLGGERVEIRD